jgi:hypothetical protein
VKGREELRNIMKRERMNRRKTTRKESRETDKQTTRSEKERGN